MIKNFLLIFLFLTQVSTDCLSSENENTPLLEEGQKDYGRMKNQKNEEGEGIHLTALIKIKPENEEDEGTQLTDLIKVKTIKRIMFSELFKPIKSENGKIKFKAGSLQSRGICKKFKKEIDQFPLKMLYNSKEFSFETETIDDIIKQNMPKKTNCCIRCCDSFFSCKWVHYCFDYCARCCCDYLDECLCFCGCYQSLEDRLCCCCPTEGGKKVCGVLSIFIPLVLGVVACGVVY